MDRYLRFNKKCKLALFLLLSVAGMMKSKAQNITFADANVKAICVANWDTNGDGELNQAEAAAVTSLDGMFMFDDGITSFDELQFFTGLTSFGEDEFNSCTSLASLTIPQAVISIGNYAFSDCSSLTTLTSYACTPPILGNEVFYDVPSILVLNVPCHTSAMYQEADGWSNFSNYEEFEYDLCPIPFADATVKAICVAHWDINEDGELSYAEAAAVTNLGTYFKSTAITSFDELEYFTSLTILPNTAFYGCTSLASIAMPASVSALGNGSFYNCTSLATMTIYAETPPTVGTNAFKNVPIDMSVYVPCGTYEIYHTASGWSEFTIVQQSGSCPIIFADANVKAICVANWDTNGDGELSYDEAAAVTDLGQVFKNKYSITSFDELQYFVSLTSIGEYAFSNCTGLTSVEIPNSVTTLGSRAFSSCESLITITIPSGVVSIGSSLFSFCSGLEQIIVEGGNVIYDSRNNCNAIIETATNKLVSGCKNTVIPAGVTIIGNGAFAGHTGLISITLPNTITQINIDAFIGCYGLEAISLPNSVTSIGGNAFGSCYSLTTLSIPNSVISIAGSAFEGCWGLESIIVETNNSVYDSRNNCNAIIKTNTNTLILGCKNTVIPNSVVTIGNSAFCGHTGLVYINIPNSVTAINNRAFAGCSSLSSITIPTSVTSIGEGAFQLCSALTSIEIPDMVTTINEYMFNWCTGLTSVTLGSSVSSIKEHAFSHSGLSSLIVHSETPPTIVSNNVFENVNTDIPIYVPAGTVAAYQSAFGWSGFTNYIDYGSPITFADANVKSLCVAHWDTNGDGELSYAEAAAVTDLGEVFRYNSSIVSFDELQYFTGLTAIGNSAFSICSNLISIEIPNNVTSIGVSAFWNCSSLASVTFGNNIASIGINAFLACSSLTSVEIPSSVISIGKSAFSQCAAIEQITVSEYNMVYDSRSNCNAIIETETNTIVSGCKNTVIPNTITAIGDEAFLGCIGLLSISIPNSVMSIGENAFGSCSSVEQICVAEENTVLDSRDNCNAIIETSTNKLIVGCKNTVIPNMVTAIGDYAFYDCSSLTSVDIPDLVETIGGHAFTFCSNLTTISIPDNVTTIGMYAFWNCTRLTSARMGNSVSFIGSGAFMGCPLTSIEIPSSMVTIEQWAFYYCTNLTTLLVFAEATPTLGEEVFGNVNHEIPVYVPCNSVGEYASTSWGDFSNFTGMCPSEITVIANPIEGGTIGGAGVYDIGAMVTLTALANDGYCFMSWTENNEVVSSNAEYTFRVTGDRNLVANFVAIPPMPVVAEYHPDPNEPNSPYVKVHWEASSFEAHIGEGTSVFGCFPFYTIYNYSIAENLFLASELEAAGVTSSPMTSLSWYATNAPGYEQQGISIWMANVSDTELTSTSHTVSGMVLVYTGTMTPEVGWNEFAFNEGSFVWDGVSNVLILCQRNNGVWNSTVYWQSQNVGFNASSYHYRNSESYNVNMANTMYTSTNRPNIILKSGETVSYNLYRANCDGTDAQLIAENLNDTQYIDETWWQLENDSYKYGVSIADSTNTDIFWSNCIEKQGNVAVQMVNLSQGTNWFSTYLDITLGDLQTALQAALPDVNSGITIKAKVGNSTLRNGSWRSTNNFVWDVAKMYRIEVPADCEITLTGTPINPAGHPITIEASTATWIGFPFSESMDPADVIPAGFAVNGDQIKGKDGNFRYTNRWRPSGINALEPGKGYMYVPASTVTEDRTLIFPTGAK